MQVCAASANQQLVQAAETLYPLVSSPYVQGGLQHERSLTKDTHCGFHGFSATACCMGQLLCTGTLQAHMWMTGRTGSSSAALPKVPAARQPCLFAASLSSAARQMSRECVACRLPQTAVSVLVRLLSPEHGFLCSALMTTSEHRAALPLRCRPGSHAGSCPIALVPMLEAHSRNQAWQTWNRAPLISLFNPERLVPLSGDLGLGLVWARCKKNHAGSTCACRL